MCINFSCIKSSFLITLFKKGEKPQKCKKLCYSKLRKPQGVWTFWDNQNLSLTQDQCSVEIGRVFCKGYPDIAILEKGVIAPKLKHF